MTVKSQKILGWIAIAVSTFLACFWAFWGIIENFHEGWNYPTLGQNLQLMFAQYLIFPLLFIVGAGVAIYWPPVGGGLHMLAAISVAWYFRGASPVVVYGGIVTPLFLLGVSYWVGRPLPKKLAVGLSAGLPLLVLMVCGVEPAIRVAGRIDDGNHEARLVEGNDVKLIWAPEGPGWPQDGVNWEEAQRRCRYLSEDGKTLAATPQDLWRLPTVEEAVRSLVRHGENSGGVWNAQTKHASYEKMPDKESPLWDKYSKVIYWWTATAADDKNAFIVVYNGQVWPRPKQAHWGYLGFRAVKANADHPD